MQSIVCRIGVVALVGACGASSATPSLDAGVPPADAYVAPIDANPNLISSSGLYSDFGTRTISTDNRTYKPTFELWADGLVKQRWINLPGGKQIDTSDMDHWVFPVGTRFWKQFSTQDGQPIETRLIEKTGADSYKMGAYVWRADGSDADWTTDGAVSVDGTDHDVPPLAQCQQCHLGEPGKILGFGAIQLSKPGGNGPLSGLAAEGLLSHPAPATEYAPAWDAVTNLAFGTLSANCGHCHNPGGSAFGPTQMILRLQVADIAQTDPHQTAIGRTTIGVPDQMYMSGAQLLRVVADDPESSAIYLRMDSRVAGTQMPPIATKDVDLVGAGAVRAWIQGL